MPNVVLEHSKDIKETKPLMKSCHDHLMESGLFTLESIKVRHLSFEESMVGGQPDQSFLVVTVSIMPGRSQENKVKLGDSLHKRINEKCKELGYQLNATVCIKETPEGLYFK